MKLFDSKGNLIERTRYESFLSKVIIDNPEFVLPVFNKINAELLRVIYILEEYKKVNRDYYYYLFQIQQAIDYHTIGQSPEQFFASNNILYFIDFYKIFFESPLFKKLSLEELPELMDSIFNIPLEPDEDAYFNMHLLSDLLSEENFYASSSSESDEKTSSPQETRQIPTLSELTQHTIKKKMLTIPCTYNSYMGFKIPIDLGSVVRPDNLFEPRGRKKLVNDGEEKDSLDIGIMTPETTENQLKNKQMTSFKSAKLQFERDPNAKLVKHFEEYEIPFISGASGTVGFILTAILGWTKSTFINVTFTPSELKMLAMGLAGGMTDQGHHSLYEAIGIFETVGFKIEMTKDYVKFYEQFLTEDFKQSEVYADFLAEYAPKNNENATPIQKRTQLN